MQRATDLKGKQRASGSPSGVFATVHRCNSASIPRGKHLSSFARRWERTVAKSAGRRAHQGRLNHPRRACFRPSRLLHRGGRWPQLPESLTLEANQHASAVLQETTLTRCAEAPTRSRTKADSAAQPLILSEIHARTSSMRYNTAATRRGWRSF